MSVTYAFYTDTYKGNILTSDNFEAFTTRAEDYIAAYTYDKCKSEDLSEYEDLLVKKCTCAVAEVLSECGVSDISTSVKTSERVGNWSVGYAAPAVVSGAPGGMINALVLNKVQLYLGRTRLMYMGVDV